MKLTFFEGQEARVKGQWENPIWVFEIIWHLPIRGGEVPSIAYKGQSSHRPGKVLEIDLGPGKLLEFENSAICPGIVLEFCKIAIETVKLSLKVIKHINSF